MTEEEYNEYLELIEKMKPSEDEVEEDLDLY